MKKKSVKKEEKPVNVYNVAEMMSLGLRGEEFRRNPSVWTKSNKEKKAYKKADAIYRNRYPNENWHNPSHHEPYLPYVCKLIIYLSKNKKFDKSVYSIMCNPNRISDYLDRYQDEKKSYVLKYSYNGKMYQPNERPSYGI